MYDALFLVWCAVNELRLSEQSDMVCYTNNPDYPQTNWFNAGPLSSRGELRAFPYDSSDGHASAFLCHARRDSLILINSLLKLMRWRWN